VVEPAEDNSRDAETQAHHQQPPAAPQASAGQRTTNQQAFTPQAAVSPPMGGGSWGAVTEVQSKSQQRAASPQTAAGQRTSEPEAFVTQAQPHLPAQPSLRAEEVGQQYRERMDPPDVDDTGEFQLGTFESSAEHTQPMLDLPGRFRRSARG
jgi:hypothetical protein